MKYVQIVAAVLAGYVLLRLTGRVRRLELVTGAWHVQEPDYVLEFDQCAGDDAFERVFAEWVRQHREDVA